jgi:hypothetical protein
MEEAPVVAAPKPSVEEKAKAEIYKEFGITAAELDRLKTEVGKLECIWVGGKPFVYRSLKRAELKTIKAGVIGGDEAIFEEKVVARCLLMPRLTEEALRADDAGLASTLSEAISAFSGYAPDGMPIKL